MECPECHKEHSAIAVYCPHCGATLPTPPAGEVAAEGEKLDIIAESAPLTTVGRQRTARKFLVPVVTILVVASGAVTYISRIHSSRPAKTVDTDIYAPVQTPPTPVLTPAEEDAVYGAAQQYASTRGNLGLERDGVSVISSTADVWLEDPATGRRFRVSLVKAGADTGWVATGMEEVD